MKRITLPLTLTLSALLLLSGGMSSTEVSHTPVPVAAQSAAQKALAPKVSKIVVIVVENHSLAEMKASMPRVYGFAKRYAYATNYTAITHPSLPNYLALAGGTTYGVTNDGSPSAHPLKSPSVFQQALSRRKTVRVYADAMKTNCALANSSTYAVRHNSWTYFPSERKACRKFDVPATQLSKDVAAHRLPNLSYIIPDLRHDAHDASLSAADSWIYARIANLQKSSDWKAGHLAIVVTADEDDRKSGNRVLTAVGSRYQAHKVVATHLTHYSLLRLTEDVVGAPHLGAAGHAPDMAHAFGIKTP